MSYLLAHGGMEPIKGIHKKLPPRQKILEKVSNIPVRISENIKKAVRFDLDENSLGEDNADVLEFYNKLKRIEKEKTEKYETQKLAFEKKREERQKRTGKSFEVIGGLKPDDYPRFLKESQAECSRVKSLKNCFLQAVGLEYKVKYDYETEYPMLVKHLRKALKTEAMSYADVLRKPVSINNKFHSKNLLNDINRCFNNEGLSCKISFEHDRGASSKLRNRTEVIKKVKEEQITTYSKVRNQSTKLRDERIKMANVTDKMRVYKSNIKVESIKSKMESLSNRYMVLSQIIEESEDLNYHAAKYEIEENRSTIDKITPFVGALKNIEKFERRKAKSAKLSVEKSAGGCFVTTAAAGKKSITSGSGAKKNTGYSKSKKNSIMKKKQARLTKFKQNVTKMGFNSDELKLSVKARGCASTRNKYKICSAESTVSAVDMSIYSCKTFIKRLFKSMEIGKMENLIGYNYESRKVVEPLCNGKCCSDKWTSLTNLENQINHLVSQIDAASTSSRF